jgi:hypothetical protein
LLALFGPAVADEAGPEVEITTPNDGAIFDEGADFEIMASVVDDSEIVRVTLFREDDAVGDDTSPPYGWSATKAKAGTYLLYVEAEDAHGNVGVSPEIAVTVETEPDGGGDEGGPEDDEDEPADDDDGNDGEDFPGTLNGAPPNVGCACRGAPWPRSHAAWLLLLVACASRRRRPRLGGDGRRSR